MAVITVFKFYKPDIAEQMLDLVKDLSKKELIELDDAAVVTWPQGKKKPESQYMHDEKHSKALGGAFWGMLLGLIFGVPFFGMTLGAGIGSVNDEEPDYGLSKEFIKEVGQKVTEGTSALFLKTSGAEVDKVADAVKEKGWNFEIISTNLTEEHEKQLQKDFGAE